MKNPNKENMNEIIGMKLIELESVGCVIDPDTLEVYPLFENGALDFGNAVSLYETSDEWFEGLSEYDLNLLVDYGLYEFLK
jgi:hypothetical protein